MTTAQFMSAADAGAHEYQSGEIRVHLQLYHTYGWVLQG